MTAEKLRKIAVFGLVGIGASLIHIVVAAIVDRAFAPSIFLSNAIGFLVAFSWSYLGHYHFTFRSSRDHRQAVPRFALTALVGYVINNAVVLALVLVTGTELIWFVVLAVAVAAACVYLLSNLWAFGRGA